MAWAFVQGKAVDGGVTASLALAFTSNVTAGNMLLAIVRTSSTTPPTGVADSLSQTFVKDFSQVQTTDANLLTIWRFFVTAGGANTVTVTNSPAINTRLIILEYSYAGTAVLDQSIGGQADGVQSITAGTVTTTLPNALLLAALGTSLATPITADTGNSFATRFDIPVGATARLHVEDRIVSATGTYGATITTGNATNAMAATLAYGESAGGGGGGTTLTGFGRRLHGFIYS